MHFIFSSFSLFLFFFFFSSIASQVPANPTWPPNFKTTVFCISNAPPSADMMNGQIYNWYYSEELNKDRLDGMSMYNNVPTFTSILIDHTNQSYTVVYYQASSVAACTWGPVNWTIAQTHPNLADFNFVGKTSINSLPAYYWKDVTASDITFHYYSSPVTGDPVLINITDPAMNAGFEAFMFMEWEDGQQDANLYTIPKEIAEACEYDPIPPFIVEYSSRLVSCRPQSFLKF